MTIFKLYQRQTDENWPELPPLHWVKVNQPEAEILDRVGKDIVIAIVTCRNGHACALRVPPFSVSLDGVVNPSIACTVLGCGGHEPLGSVLEGYGT